MYADKRPRYSVSMLREEVADPIMSSTNIALYKSSPQRSGSATDNLKGRAPSGRLSARRKVALSNFWSKTLYAKSCKWVTKKTLICLPNSALTIWLAISEPSLSFVDANDSIAIFLMRLKKEDVKPIAPK
jgi:hypothetical protein